MVGSVFATAHQNGNFSDVDGDHWAGDAIEQMVKYGVINGYDDGTFRPDQAVKRDEFSTMMVKSLNLSIDWNAESSFNDMDDAYWAVPYVETAKYYLTGYQSGGKVYFKPQEKAVREDMAVALVKALGYENASYDDDELAIFEDASSISPNLKKYVCIAVDKGIMSGSINGNKRYFNPTSAITRAESAVLLNQVIEDEAIDLEKVTFGDTEKVVFDDSTEESSEYTSTHLKVQEVDGKLKLTWNEINHNDLNGYKVVASKHDSSPAYPENGYKEWITDTSRTSAYIKAGSSYNSGDFGGQFEAGETYYFSITAVYGNGTKLTGNVVTYKVPGSSNSSEESDEAYSVPKLTVTKSNGKLNLNWEQINHSKLNGYKVVASLSDSMPAYPENGYKVWITDKTRTYATISPGDGYNSGDIGKFESGKTYYISITAVYSDKKVAGNVVKVTMP